LTAPPTAAELAGRQIPGELPRPVDIDMLRQIREDNLCAWCFEPLGDRRAEFNGGVGHLACAMFAHHSVLGDQDGPAAPWIPGVDSWREDPLLPFCRRLGREAGRLGIDPQKLAQAIGRAHHG
jgi:hypothetical protein